MPRDAKISERRNDDKPYVEIVVQPASKSLRFRYECEGRATGSMPGSTSTFDNKTFPTIRVVGWRSGRGIVIVSCVTKDPPHRPHPHNLIGKDTCDRGVCRMDITADKPEVQFPNLGIQCVKKKNLHDSLEIRKELRVDPFRTGFDHMDKVCAMDLNSVRLCFQVFIEGRDGKINVPLRPALSVPIYDKKSRSDLVICKMSHSSATVDGGTEMILLTEKVSRENIQVRFFETVDDRRVWEDYGHFQALDIHKQFAIILRTPSYRNRNVQEPVSVYVELVRPSDGKTSDAWPFQMLPLESYHCEANSLRRKRRRFGENPAAQRMMRQLQTQAEKETSLRLDDSPAMGPDCSGPTRFPGEELDPFPISTPYNLPKPEVVAPVDDRTSTSGFGNVGVLVDLSCYGAEALPGTLPSHMAFGSHDVPPTFALNDLAPPAGPDSPFGATLNPETDRFQRFDPFSLNFHGQNHCQQSSATMCHENFTIPERILDAVVKETSVTDSPMNFHHLLDSDELAAYAAAFSEGGLALTDGCNAKKETNGPPSVTRWATKQLL